MTHIGVSTLHIHTPNVCHTTAKEKSRRTSRKIATPRTAAFEKSKAAVFYAHRRQWEDAAMLLRI